MRGGSIRGLRGRLLGTVLLAVVAALALVIGAFNLVLSTRLDSDANDLLRARAASALGALQVVDGRLTSPEAPDDTTLDRTIWIFAGTRALESPRVGAALDLAARGLAGGPSRRIDVPRDSVRLLAVPVVQRGRRVGTVVAGLSLTPYDRTRRLVLLGSCALGLVLMLAVALAARWLLAAGLRPVARMTADAADWSARDLDRRFDLGPPRDELTQLAATLDGLLDRLAAGIRREQRFSAELSHELRTPLSRVRMQAQLALRDGIAPEAYRTAMAAILRSADDAARSLDALISAARAELSGRRGTADAREVALAAARGCGVQASELGIEVGVASAMPGLRVGAEAELVERLLRPLIENACRYAAGFVEVSVARERGSIVYVVADDGPGISAAEREEIFEPGIRGSAAATATVPHAGAGLGLSLARRLTHAVGGEIEVLPTPSGARIAARLPAG